MIMRGCSAYLATMRGVVKRTGSNHVQQIHMAVNLVAVLLSDAPDTRDCSISRTPIRIRQASEYPIITLECEGSTTGIGELKLNYISQSQVRSTEGMR
jgi:hypothetical protein